MEGLKFLPAEKVGLPSNYQQQESFRMNQPSIKRVLQPEINIKGSQPEVIENNQRKNSALDKTKIKNTKKRFKIRRKQKNRSYFVYQHVLITKYLTF